MTFFSDTKERKTNFFLSLKKHPRPFISIKNRTGVHSEKCDLNAYFWSFGLPCIIYLTLVVSHHPFRLHLNQYPKHPPFPRRDKNIYYMTFKSYAVQSFNSYNNIICTNKQRTQ